MNRAEFAKLHADLLEEVGLLFLLFLLLLLLLLLYLLLFFLLLLLLLQVVQLEFSEYDKTGSGRISERDTCHFILKNSKIPPKKQVLRS